MGNRGCWTNRSCDQGMMVDQTRPNNSAHQTLATSAPCPSSYDWRLRPSTLRGTKVPSPSSSSINLFYVAVCMTLLGPGPRRCGKAVVYFVVTT